MSILICLVFSQGEILFQSFYLTALQEIRKKKRNQLKTTNSKKQENKQCGSFPATMIFSLFYLLFTALPEPQCAGGLEEEEEEEGQVVEEEDERDGEVLGRARSHGR